MTDAQVIAESVELAGWIVAAAILLHAIWTS